MTLTGSTSKRSAAKSGVTLLELSVTILVLLMMIVVFFLGAQAWKRGSDRAGCVMQIRNVQVGVRSFANLNGFGPNQSVVPFDLKSEVIGPNRFVERIPRCPASGTYADGANRIPEIGSLYLTCSLEKDDDHRPRGFADW